MTLYDISMEIYEEMTVYKDRKKKRPKRKITHKYAVNGTNESKITLGLHTGTHIDAPFHMLKDGETIEKIDIERLIGKVRVLDLTQLYDRITADDLSKKKIENGSFVLFKTRNSLSNGFNRSFIFLEKSGAQYLEEKDIIGVGIDSLGIERSQPGHETHKILMENGCIIIEGLRLKDVPEGDYMMYALPLKIRGGDGAPARVVLADLKNE